MTNVAVKMQNNVIPFAVIGNEGKQPKLKKDGSPKKTHCNKVAGQSSEVYAFKAKDEIHAIIDVLNYNIMQAPNSEKKKIACRNKLLFIIGINIGIRASDIRLLKWSFFFKMENGEIAFKSSYCLQPKKQKKQKKFVKLFFNDAVKAAIIEYVEQYPVENMDDYIFLSRNNQPMTVQQMWNIVKSIAAEAGIEQNIGSHSLRKTWGYWCWHEAEDKNKALVILQQCFNHSSTLTTLRYIGVLDNELSDMYNSISLGFFGDEDDGEDDDD